MFSNPTGATLTGNPADNGMLNLCAWRSFGKGMGPCAILEIKQELAQANGGGIICKSTGIAQSKPY